METKTQYITDTEGNKTAVVLPIDEYDSLMEDLHDLAIIAERREEACICLEEVKKKLAVDGFLQD